MLIYPCFLPHLSDMHKQVTLHTRACPLREADMTTEMCLTAKDSEVNVHDQLIEHIPVIHP